MKHRISRSGMIVEATGGKKKKGIPLSHVRKLGKFAGVNWDKVDFGIAALKDGIEIEAEEHADVTKGSVKTATKIAVAHLREDPRYYEKLERLEKGDYNEDDDEGKKKTKVTPEMQKAIVAFIRKNPEPSDDDFHDMAEKLGIHPSQAEEVVYKIAHKLTQKKTEAVNTAVQLKRKASALKVGLPGHAHSKPKKHKKHKKKVSPGLVEAAGKGNTMSVNLEMLPDARDPQFTAVWGNDGGRRVQLERIHNTGLDSIEGMKPVFSAVKYRINEKMGIDKNVLVEFGDMSFKFRMPDVIKQRIHEAMERIGLTLNGAAELVECGRAQGSLLEGAGVNTLSVSLQSTLTGTGFDALPRPKYKAILATTSGIVIDAIKRRGQNPAAPETLQAYKRIAKLPRLKVKITNIATALKYVTDNYEGALRAAASKIAELVIQELALSAGAQP